MVVEPSGNNLMNINRSRDAQAAAPRETGAFGFLATSCKTPCGVPPFAIKTGAKKRPRNRLQGPKTKRIQLSNQEQKNAIFAPRNALKTGRLNGLADSRGFIGGAIRPPAAARIFLPTMPALPSLPQLLPHCQKTRGKCAFFPDLSSGENGCPEYFRAGLFSTRENPGMHTSFSPPQPA